MYPGICSQSSVGSAAGAMRDDLRRSGGNNTRHRRDSRRARNWSAVRSRRQTETAAPREGMPATDFPERCAPIPCLPKSTSRTHLAEIKLRGHSATAACSPAVGCILRIREQRVAHVMRCDAVRSIFSAFTRSAPRVTCSQILRTGRTSLPKTQKP